MILLDANLLIYSYAYSMPEHKSAKSWLDEKINSNARIGMPWASLLAFVRIVSNPRIFSKAPLPSIAWKQVQQWLDCDNVWIPEATSRHSKILVGLLEKQASSSNLVSDAHLAALAIEHGLVLCSTDRDFSRFVDLKWQNPLDP